MTTGLLGHMGRAVLTADGLLRQGITAAMNSSQARHPGRIQWGDSRGQRSGADWDRGHKQIAGISQAAHLSQQNRSGIKHATFYMHLQAD